VVEVVAEVMGLATIVAPSATTNGVVRSTIEEPSFVSLLNFDPKPCVSCPDRSKYTSLRVAAAVAVVAVVLVVVIAMDVVVPDAIDLTVDVRVQLYARLLLISETYNTQ
jgi:hypothetical protein